MFILRRAAVEGMPDGSDVAARVEVAVRRARASNDPMVTKAAELVLSTAWVDYIQATQRPSLNVIYGDPAIVRSLPLPGQTLRVAEAAPSLARHLLAVSAVNPIYARLRDVAVAEASANGGQVSERIMLNLERSRLLPDTGKYIFVNTAEQWLHMIDEGQEVGSMKVVVGNKLDYGLPTPIVTSTIYYAIANPYWHVPPHLIRKYALEIVKGPDAYLKAHGYEVISDFGEHPTVLTPSLVDWEAVAVGTQSVNLRQRPGRNNSMGKMKFPFPNREGIYLHDTPNREYFDSAKWPDRAQSNGCIRVEDYRRLAKWLFGRDVTASGDQPEQILALPQAVRVYVTYLTLVPDASGLKSFADRYGWDRQGVVAGGIDTTVSSPLTVREERR